MSQRQIPLAQFLHRSVGAHLDCSDAGAEDLGILEVQEAAKVIGESVDKNAKIIFGIMRDEKLKKGQIRIIVIATGFPENAMEGAVSHPERSLFSMPVKEQEEVRGKIYHEMAKPDVKTVSAPEEPKKERPEPIVTARSEKPVEQIKPIVEEDDSWGGAIPSFLRRNKK